MKQLGKTITSFIFNTKTKIGESRLVEWETPAWCSQ